MKRTLSQLIIVFIFLSSVGITHAQTVEVSGIVSGTWDVDTVKVVGDIEVREAVSLNILPGVNVIFMGEYFFNISGAINASGSASSPIVFSMADTTGFNNDTLPDGGWKNIRIENINTSLDSILFKHCNFSYGKAVANDSVHGYGGVFCIRNSNKISIENCTFSSNYAYYSGGAIYLEQANICLRNNSFENNRCGQAFVDYGYGGGVCSDWSEPQIENNTFIQNSSTGIGGGLSVRFKDCPVMFNIFHDNYSALGGGFGILHIDTCHFAISNNLFTQNGAYFFGAAISNNDCSPTYVNNTITDNHCDGGGGAFYCKDSVVPNLHNNIMYGNTQFGGDVNQIYLMDLLSQPNFYYNTIEGGAADIYGTGGSAFSGDYENNMDSDPIFEPGTYSLTLESPCVNGGNPDTSSLLIPETDLAGNLRIKDLIIDMGAYENQQSVGVNFTSPDDDFSFTSFPNPTRDRVEFTFNLPSPSSVKLNISSLSGKQLCKIFDGNMDSGEHNFVWNIADKTIPPGIYLATLAFDDLRFERKIVITK